MSFTRMYFAREFGASALAFLTGIEWFMALLAIPFGYLKDRYGGRWPIYLGASGSLAFTSLIFVKAPEALSVVLSLSTLAWAAAWPSIIATATGRYGTSATSYARITLGAGFGWGFGSAIMGFIHRAFGLVGVVTSMIATYLLAYALFIVDLKDVEKVAEPATVRLKDLMLTIRMLTYFVLSIVVCVFARELLYVFMTVKLQKEVSTLEFFTLTEEEMFGIVYGALASVLSMPMRLAAGKLADKLGAFRLYKLAVLTYIAYAWVFQATYGIYAALLWQIPLFPLIDVATYSLAIKHAPEKLRTSVIGVITAFSSLGGSLVTLTKPLIDVVEGVSGYALASFSLVVSLIFIDRFQSKVANDKERDDLK